MNHGYGVSHGGEANARVARRPDLEVILIDEQCLYKLTTLVSQSYLLPLPTQLARQHEVGYDEAEADIEIERQTGPIVVRKLLPGTAISTHLLMPALGRSILLAECRLGSRDRTSRVAS